MSNYYDQHGRTIYADNTGCFEKLGILAYAGAGLYISNLIMNSTKSLALGFLSFAILIAVTIFIKTRLEEKAMRVFNIVGIVLFIIIVIWGTFFLWQWQSNNNIRF